MNTNNPNENTGVGELPIVPEQTTEDFLANTNWNEVDRSIALIQPGRYSWEVKEWTLEVNEAKQTKSLKIVCKALQDMPSVDGKTLKAGFPLYHRIGLTPTEAYDEKSIKKNIAMFLVDGLGASALMPLTQHIGKQFDATVVVRPAKNGYAESNSFAKFFRKQSI